MEKRNRHLSPATCRALMIPFPSNDFTPTFSQHPPQFFLPPLSRIPPITISTSRRSSLRSSSSALPLPLPSAVHGWSILQRTASTSLCRPPPPPPKASPFLPCPRHRIAGPRGFSALSLRREFLRLSSTAASIPTTMISIVCGICLRRESRVKRDLGWFRNFRNFRISKFLSLKKKRRRLKEDSKKRNIQGGIESLDRKCKIREKNLEEMKDLLLLLFFSFFFFE